MGNSGTFVDNSAGRNGAAIHVNSGSLTVNYNRFYNNTGNAQVYVAGGTVNLNYNWWGTNIGPRGVSVIGTVTLSNYFVVDISVVSIDYSQNITTLSYSFHLNNFGAFNVSDIPVFDGNVSTTEGYGDTYVSKLPATHVLNFTPDMGELVIFTVDGFVSTLFNLYVNATGGDDGNSGASWSDAFQSIQKALEVAGDGATIHVAGGNYNNSNVILQNNTNLTIYRNITIIGETSLSGEEVILNALNNGRIFFIANGINVTLINLTFTNGKLTGTNNNSGGAIYNNGSKVTIIGSNFINNTANNGGAIHNENGTNFFISENTSFINNTASNYGGAIYNYFGANFTVGNGSTFVNNSANTYGGAIYNSGINFSVGNNSAFVNNSANTYGGAICNNYGANFSVGNNGIFVNNSANYGGAIYNRDANFSIGSGTFVNNSASSYGGAICNNYGANFSVGNSAFVNNSARRYGGAIYNEGVNFSVGSGSAFVNNSAINDNGGAIYNTGANFAVRNNVTFVDNSAGINGGAIYTSANSTVNYNRFYNNAGNGQVYIYGGNVNLNFNWWGNNTNPIGTSIVRAVGNLTLSNYYILRVSLNSTFNTSQNATLNYTKNTVAVLSYAFVLNTTAANNLSLLPYFTVDVLIRNSTGIVNNSSGDVRSFTFSQEVMLTNNDPQASINALVDGEDLVLVIENNTIVNLTIVKVANVTNVSNNGTINFTITIANIGDNIASNVTFTDLLGDKFRLINWTGGLSYNNTSGIWNVGDIEGKTNVTLHMVVQVIKSGEINNTVNNVTALESLKDPNINSTVTITVTPVVNLNITKVSNVTGVSHIGDHVKYTITIKNNGLDNASNVSVYDILDSKLTYVTYNSLTGTYNNNTGLWSVGTLNVNQTATLEIEVIIANIGTIENIANVTANEIILNGSNTNTNTTIHVDPLNSTLTINPVTNTKINSNVSINGTLLDEKGAPISGVTINLTVNNVSYNATTGVSGNWNIIYHVGSTGVINIAAEFVGNANYTASANATYFDGLTLNSTLVINPVTNTKINSNVSINGTLLDEKGAPISGVTINLTVNNVSYNATTNVTGNWNIIYPVVATGVINVVAEFVGNANYTASANATYFDGLTLNSTLVINPVTNTKINSNVSINGSLLDEKGSPISGVTINLTVNNVSYNVSTNASGNWNITYHVVSTGVINVVAEFVGNANYSASANVTYFNGLTLNSTLVINPITNTKINGNVSINGSLLDEKGSPISGVTISLTVNNVSYSATTNASGNWNIIYHVGLTGVINVVAEFVGNGNYSASANVTYLDGLALNSTLVINPVKDTKINSSVSINGTLLDERGAPISGITINLTVNNVSYSATTNASGNWNVSYPVVVTGVINVVAEFVGNANYTASANTTYFDGLTLNSTLVINPVINTKINSSVSINGTLLDEKGAPISGVIVNLTVNGVNYSATTGASGNWNVSYHVVATGVINVVAEFVGNANFTASANTTYFNGLALNSTLVINPVLDTKINSSVSINGSLVDEKGAPISGVIVNLTVNGVNYSATTNANGIWNVSYHVVATGVINVVAEFVGNANYTFSANNTYFDGLALNSTLIINPIPNTNVNSSVSINGSLLDERGAPISGVTINLTVNGVNYNSTTGASGNWNITYFVSSEELVNVVVEFVGNANYTAAANTTYFNGAALNSTLTINPIPNTKINSNVSINGSLFDENNSAISNVTVVVTVNGVNYNSTTDNGGKWSITYLVKSSGNINVVVEFTGNINHTAAVNETSFNGVSLNSNLVINPIPDTKVNNNVSINGTLLDENNKSINNVQVVVTVNGVNYNVTTDVNGKWSITYLVNSTGLFNVLVEFTGNGNYSASVNGTSFYGLDLSNNLTINPIPDTRVNSSVSINGTLLDESNKPISNVRVVVTVNDVSYNSTTDNSGKWSITYFVNSTGHISVVAEFTGNINYSAAVDETNFNGLDLNSNLVINPIPDTRVNSSVSINGTLLDESNNSISNVRVVVTVNGINYNSTTDNSGKWSIIYLVKSSGNINVVAEFNGNSNYSAAVNSSTFNGVSLNSKLVINPVTNTKVNSSVSINGSLLDESNKAISNARVVVTVNGASYNATTDESGKWSITYLVKSSGNINVVAEFTGNTNHAAAVNETSFNGVSLNSKLVINPVVNTKVNSSVSINGTLLDESSKAISNVCVVVTVNGVSYNVTTDVSGKWGIIYLVKSSGSINVVAEFTGNVNYSAAVNSTSFNGLPLNSTLVINPVSGAQMNSSVSINGTLLDESNKAISNVRVVVTVNGINYNTTTDASGKWNINYTVNSTGLVNVVAVFNGNDRYVSAANSTTFIVPNNVNISIIKIASINGINNSPNAHFGDTVIYTINVVNNGATTATGVLVTEIIENTKLKLNKASTTQGYYNNTNGLWTIGELKASKTVTLTINATIIAIGNISNSANVSANENNINSNNKNTVNISVNDVNISMGMVSNVTWQNNPHYGDVVTYKITITNNGITDGHGVNITDILGDKLKFINYSTTDGSTYDKNTGIWSIDTLKAGNNVTLTITARINDLGEIENIAKINTNESNINNKTNASIKFTVNDVNLTIVKTSNITGNALVEDYITYTIKVTNNGLNAAFNFNVLEKLDSKLEFISYSSNIGTYNNMTGLWNISNLSSGKTATLTITGKIISVGTIKNTAIINTTTKNIGNNNSSTNIISEAIPTQISTLNVIVAVDNSVKLESTLKDGNAKPIADKEVKFYVNGKLIGTAKTDAKGIAYLRYIPTKTGTLTYISSFTDPTGVYADSTSLKSTIIITKDKINLTTILPNGTVGDKKTIKVKATNSEGRIVPNKTFIVYINGKKVGNYKTNSKGEFTIKTTLRSSNKLQIKFAGDNKYNKLSKTYTFKAKKEKTITTIYYTKTKYGNSIILKAKLTNGKGKALAGKYIKFYVAGKYVGKAKTNKKGIAIFKYTPKKKK
ncbi:beta strand repeat-containing protein [Methanobrevibacter filiformis]|uniref:DUF11 domain-containing protein n=1 Tax=Methanobrevibacter filiformis TaxID=55758 RepID=A0A166FIJ1_9EURY|nr:carboxypeptidase regulatory-like domain-containing protein [Methanobrevibacter filiformis]KZX17711.1 hypothetical protein MBFIL_00010 [Methanobrevibacter filiformis]